MKVGILAEPRRVQLSDAPEPTPGAGELTVRLAACGVCGTDLEKLRGNYKTAGILGHEAVGVVAATGPGIRDFDVGSRVLVHHHVPCYECAVCRRGDFTFCPTFSKTNLDPGGFAETFRASAHHVRHGAVLRLGDRVSFDVGALLEPAGCAQTALRRVGFTKGSSVFIVGLGPVGLLYERLARAAGASWIGGAEISEKRRQAFRRGGGDVALDPRPPQDVSAAVADATGGDGVDLAVVATGSPEATRLAASLPRRGGTLNLFGLPAPGSRLEVDLQELYLRGLRVVPSYATTEPDLIEVHRLVMEHKVDFHDLVSHRLPLERIEEAFRVAARPEESLKVLVTGPAYGPTAG